MLFIGSMSQKGMAGMLGWMCHTAKLCEMGTVKSMPAQLVHWKRVVDCLADSVDFHKKGRVYCERKPEVTGPENNKIQSICHTRSLELDFEWYIFDCSFIIIQFLLSVLISFVVSDYEMCENNFKSYLKSSFL